MTRATRKLIKLHIPPGIDSSQVMQELVFKGATRISSDTATVKQILDVWQNNKTVICCGTIPQSFGADVVDILVTSSPHILTPNAINVLNGGPIVEQFERIVQQYGIDVGDHKSNSSGITGAPSIEDCKYCHYIKDNFYDKKIDNYRVTYRSSHFFVMPGLGQFINGYFLAIPFGHITSMAELGSTDLLRELLEVIDDVKYIINLTYGSPSILVWENGTGHGGYGKAKDSVVHAHVHIAPSTLSPKSIKSISGFSFDEITSKEIRDYGENSYLLLKGEDDSWFINDDPELYIPRQYIRQLLADEYKVGDIWNWRTHMFLEKICETMRDVNAALKANWENLPVRIRERVKDYVDNI